MTKSVTTLEDKYRQVGGRVFISSNQALVRLPLDQSRRDRAAGLKTAGFISGYRGSPLGVYDSALWGAQKLLDEHAIRFRPGLNEELAVSAIRGTQELHWFGDSEVQGVFGLWYGKGVGVDRACEALKLGNLEGTAAVGGFLAVAGDDHGGKSSDSAHQSEQTLMAAMLPVLYPATIGEIIEFGLFGWAMSRFSGAYVGLKCVTDTLDLSASVELPDPHRRYVLPTDIELPPEGLNLRPNLPPLVEEDWLVNKRLPAATAFARVNGIDRTIIDAPRRTLSIVSAGKAFVDVQQALFDLGCDAQTCARLGIRLYKPGLVWPMDGEGLRRFAEHSQAVLVVEEKRPVMEDQVARHLYTLDADRRPALAGKRDLRGAALLPATGELSVPVVRRAIATMLEQLGIVDSAVQTRFEGLRQLEVRGQTLGTSKRRPAYFCSGCPHNLSTKLPEGSVALGGIGCHGLAAMVMQRDTMQFMPMGHEGSNWGSVQGFLSGESPHIFANMGDGTYAHSGILSIRQAVAERANITFKILYNDAVAMTGGQPIEARMTPLHVVQQLLAEGVRPVHLVSDDPAQYRDVQLPTHASLHHRDELDAIQRALREVKGVSAIVYEQTCAAEKRRRRKRGKLPDPDVRVFIHPEVCEGCGDCSVQSNCLSVEPLATPLGRKRKINQSTCNKDYSCLKGLCPSFVTVTGASIAVRSRTDAETLALDRAIAALPEPTCLELGEAGYNILVGGVGGTGVLTIGALLGMAAHLDGKGCTILDMTGMAQKGGAVTSHIRVASSPENIFTSRLSEGMSDLLMLCDMVVGAGPDVLKTVRPGHTRAIVNEDVAPTGEFQAHRDADLGTQQLQAAIVQALGTSAGELLHALHASELATELTGDSIGTNVLMLGYAAQKGLLPVTLASLERAIRLNGTFVEGNLRTFALGRLAAHDPEVLTGALGHKLAGETPEDSTLEELVAHRTQLLTDYQNAQYAQTYRAFVSGVQERVTKLQLKGVEAFVRAVAFTLARLMAYKDEYEVARLYTSDVFRERLNAQFSGDYKLTFHLAPPLLPGKDLTGRPKKRRYPGWVIGILFQVLARLKFLRGTWLDIVGYTAERRMERRLIREYRALIEGLLPRLEEENLPEAVALAREAGEIRGFGLVKLASAAEYEPKLARLMEDFERASERPARDGSAQGARARVLPVLP